MLLCGEMRPILRNEIIAPSRLLPLPGGKRIEVRGFGGIFKLSKHLQSFAGNKKPRRSEAWRGGGS
jgi:hypothetical protein